MTTTETPAPSTPTPTAPPPVGPRTTKSCYLTVSFTAAFQIQEVWLRGPTPPWHASGWRGALDVVAFATQGDDYPDAQGQMLRTLASAHLFQRPSAFAALIPYIRDLSTAERLRTEVLDWAAHLTPDAGLDAATIDARVRTIEALVKDTETRWGHYEPTQEPTDLPTILDRCDPTKIFIEVSPLGVRKLVPITVQEARDLVAVASEADTIDLDGGPFQLGECGGLGWRYVAPICCPGVRDGMLIFEHRDPVAPQQEG